MVGAFIVYTIMWFLLTIYNTLTMMFICMYCIGLTSSFLLTLSNIYLGELASPKNREILGIASAVSFAIGKETQYAILSLDNYFILNFFPFTFSILALITSYWTPESPYYLVSINSDDQAKRIVAWLNDNHRVDEEYQNVRKYVHLEQDSDDSTILKTFIRPENLKLFLFYALVYGVSFVNSNTVMLVYGYHIIKPLNIAVDKQSYTNLYSTIHIFSYICGFFTIRTCRRRDLLLIGLVVSALFQAIIAFCFLVEESHDYNNVPFVSYFILVLLILFLIWTTTTILSASEILRTEMFSYKMKFFCYTLVNTVQDGMLFLQLRFFFSIADTLGQSTNLFIYCGCAIVGAVSVYYFMRDTKNKSLLVIRKEYNSYGLTPEGKENTINVSFSIAEM